MKRFGLFLLKNNIHLMTLVFVGWAVWAACNWTELALVQKLVMGMYAWLIVHEYEEGYNGRFVALFAQVFHFDVAALLPGLTHIAQAVYITAMFSLALIFPDVLWLSLATFILGIFEGFVHNMGIFIFRLRGVSPGWWTAVLMAAYAIWALVVLNHNIDYAGIQWLWTALYFLGTFILLEVWFQHLIGSSLPRFAKSMKAYLKKRFN